MIFMTSGCNNQNNSKEYFKNWNECSSLTALIEYVEDVTNKNSTNYIPVEDRIATFDMDGTFLTEKPFSMDFLVTKYQIDSVLKDPVLGKQINKIIKDYPTGDFDEKTYAKLDILKKKAFGGVSEDSIAETAYKFMTTGAYDTKKFPNFKNGELFYVPMLELFQHLQKYDFKIFVVSGSDRSILWGCIKALKEVYPSYKFQLDRIQLIGSDWNLKAKKMTSKNSDYIFQKEDEVVRDTSMLATSIKMQKVINIYRQIGKYPVFSGGNMNVRSTVTLACGSSVSLTTTSPIVTNWPPSVSSTLCSTMTSRHGLTTSSSPLFVMVHLTVMRPPDVASNGAKTSVTTRFAHTPVYAPDIS